MAGKLWGTAWPEPLDPVERYRLAAKAASGSANTRLPVDSDRDDELTRLGHTFNSLLSLRFEVPKLITVSAMWPSKLTPLAASPPSWSRPDAAAQFATDGVR